MSALGNYIHHYYFNYKKFGVTRKNPAGGGTPNYSVQIINNRIGSNIKPISSEAIATLESRLKINSDIEKDRQLSDLQQRKQTLINAVYQLLYERSKNITGIHRVSTVAKGGDVWYTGKNGNRYTQNLGNSTWATNLDHSELKKMSDNANNLYRKINKLIDKINKAKQNKDTSKDLMELVNLFEQYTHLTMTPTKNVLAEITAALSLYCYNGAIYDTSGRFGQMMIATCDDLCYDLAQSTTDDVVTKAAIDIINQGVQGDISSAANFNKKLVSTGYKIFGTNSDNKNQYSIGTTKNKVDVKIRINDEEVLVNAKTRSNLDSSDRVILQDVDLYTSLIFLNSQISGLEDFGNHWLNIHAANQTVGFQEHSQLDEILKKEVAYEALCSGNPFKTNVDSANVFAYVNRSTGKVYVKSARELLENINGLDNRIGGLQKISTIHLQNIWQQEIWQRLNNILTEIHNAKLSIALNIKFE